MRAVVSHEFDVVKMDDGDSTTRFRIRGGVYTHARILVRQYCPSSFHSWSPFAQPRGFLNRRSGSLVSSPIDLESHLEWEAAKMLGKEQKRRKEEQLCTINLKELRALGYIKSLPTYQNINVLNHRPKTRSVFHTRVVAVTQVA